MDKVMRDKYPARIQTPSPSSRPTQSSQDQFSQERDFRRAPSPAENDFTSKRQLGLPRRRYDETPQSFNADGRRQHRDFTPPRDRDFAPLQLAGGDNYGNRTFFRSPMPTPTDNGARRYDQRRYNGLVQPQPWGGNRGYEDVRRSSFPRYSDGQSNERGRPTPQQGGRGTLTASPRPLLMQQPIQPVQNGPGIWTSRRNFDSSPS